MNTKMPRLNRLPMQRRVMKDSRTGNTTDCPKQHNGQKPSGHIILVLLIEIIGEKKSYNKKYGIA